MRGTCSDSAIRVATVSRSGPVSTIVRTLRGQVAQDRVRLVGLAEKAPIQPAAKPIGEPAADRHNPHHAGDDARRHARTRRRSRAATSRRC